jgi:transcriptional regulator NrdR family protein
MNCLMCGGKTRVLDSRMAGATSRRRRECMECGYRFYTREVAEEVGAPVTRADHLRAMTDGELAEAIGRRATDCLCDVVCRGKACRAKTPEECVRVALAWLREKR